MSRKMPSRVYNNNKPHKQFVSERVCSTKHGGKKECCTYNIMKLIFVVYYKREKEKRYLLKNNLSFYKMDEIKKKKKSIPSMYASFKFCLKVGYTKKN